MAIFEQYTIKPLKKVEEQSNTATISETVKIIDSRQLKDFKDQSFGGYKISQASMALEKAILEDKLEPALHWALQLFLSGIVTPLWNKLISIASKSINIGNSKLPEFLYNKTKQWETIVDNGKYTKDNILLLRNHSGVRLLLAEMICILCLARKHKIAGLPKIKKEEFIIDHFNSKLESTNTNFTNDICIDGDPSEIRVAINEFATHIYNNKSMKALYWFNWIMEWVKINSKKYGKYECGSRIVESVDGKYYKDVVWFIWSAINKIRQCKFDNSSNLDTSNQVIYLYKLYTNKFTSGCIARKQPLIIWAILYLTETIDCNIPLIDRPHILFQSLLGIDKIIMNLKSQEVHSVINTNALNVVVKNNYLQQPRIAKKMITTPQLLSNTQAPSNNSVNTQSQTTTITPTIKKLNDIYNLDRMMYA